MGIWVRDPQMAAIERRPAWSRLNRELGRDGYSFAYPFSGDDVVLQQVVKRASYYETTHVATGHGPTLIAAVVDAATRVHLSLTARLALCELLIDEVL